MNIETMHESLMKRLEIRQQIHESGRDLYESIQNEDLRYLVGEIMALNEDWIINLPNTVGAVEILSMGFTCNQKKFIENLIERTNFPPIQERMKRECKSCIGFRKKKKGNQCSIFDTLICIARGGGDTCECHMTPDEYQRAVYLRQP